MQPFLGILGGITAVSMLISLYLTVKKKFRKRVIRFAWLSTFLQLVILILALLVCAVAETAPEMSSTDSPQATEDPIQTEPLTTATIPQPEDPRLGFSPSAGENTDPSLFDIQWDICQGEEFLTDYFRENPIFFSLDENYFALPGISTFRGSNYRDTASWGTLVTEEEAMTVAWRHKIGRLDRFGGCGWTGQPLVVQWDSQTKAIMTQMYESKREKEDLVEVIYATLDGYIHFYDLEDGTETRDAIDMGMNFKGSGTLDPRGYPLLYVGAGQYTNGASPRIFVVNLITGKIIYQYGHNDSFAHRDWCAFDAAPLVDGSSDTLIWPGENGVLYTFRLNTRYDPEAGTISVTPEEPVKTRYTSLYSEDGRYVGYESSPVIADHFLYNGENGGLLYCVDLNTMELIWAQDLGDEVDATPLFQWEADGRGSLYAGSSLNRSAEDNKGSATIYKLDAENGEIIWEFTRKCELDDDIAGGILGSPILGRENTDMEGLIVFAIGRTPSAYQGALVALDTETGEKIWEISTGNYTWSSPVAMYNENGDAYIFLANASGVCRFIDGSTGQVLDTLELKETVEASPVAFGNMIVIGSRERIYGIRIS